MAQDEADTLGTTRDAYDPHNINGDVIVYRISGAFFFGAASAVSGVLDRIGEYPKVFVLDFSEVPLVDSTATRALESFVHKLQRSGTRIYFVGTGKSVRRTLLIAGFRKPVVRYATSAKDAVAHWRSAGRTEMSEPG